MPILKVPIVHKFGIISHSQRVELQERLLRQTLNKDNSKQKIRENPLEVLEKFVEKYMSCSVEDKEHFREKAEKVLLRCKRRAALVTCGEGKHADLPLAWSELAILAQCKGKIQEDCFSILNKSLSHAPLNDDNIPTLFFLAESTLYWLRTDSINQPYLRTAEIRLLKMGQLVFLRLYYHHCIGNLADLLEFKTRLKTYLEGVDDHQTLYLSYPNVLFSIRLISTVGKIIVQNNQDSSMEMASPEKMQTLSTAIIRALLLWRSSVVAKTGLKKALVGMLMMSKFLAQEDWITSFMSLSIIGEAARSNLTVCKCLQDVARGVIIEMSSTPADSKATINHFPQHKQPPETANSETKPITPTTANKENTDEFQEVINDILADFDDIINKGKLDHEKPPSKITTVKEEKYKKKQDIFSKRSPSRLPTHMRNVSPGSAYMPVTPSTAFQNFSKAPPLHGIRSWPWETAYQYSQILVDVCINGNSAPVQKSALMGKWEDADVTTFRPGVPNFCLESCGLVDLLEFRQLPPGAEKKDLNEEWSWKVRYGALSGLVAITHSLYGDALRHGMRSAAFSLIKATQECQYQDDNVLEAVKASQVEHGGVAEASDKAQYTIWTRICYGLSEKFLNPVIHKSPATTANASITPRSQNIARSQATTHSRNIMQSTTPRPKTPKTTTLKEDLLLHTTLNPKSVPSFHSRNMINLNRVVEDQWRKELLRQHEEEETNKEKDMLKKLKEQEKEQILIMEKRKIKLKNKNVLAPYELSK